MLARRSVRLWILAGVASLSNGVASAELAASYRNLPLTFEENQGQAPPAVRFLAHAGGSSISLSETAIEVKAFRIEFVGANRAASLEGVERLSGKTNYFRGRDAKGWLAGIPNFGGVRYRGLYPGIDLVCHGSSGSTFEYDFRVAAGADLRRIRLHIAGAKAVRLDENGNLILSGAEGDLRQMKPRVYQEVNGVQMPVEARYKILGDRDIGFAMGPHDPTEPLVIDPVLTYATYLAGSRDNSITGIALDGGGNIYVTGSTNSGDFPTTPGSYHPQYIGGEGTYTEGTPPNQITITNYFRDIFVTKLDSSGTRMIYSTYVGGTGDDDASGITVDSAGNVYVSGQTDSTDFPVTSDALQKNNKGGYFGSDAVLVKLDPRGAKLLYSTYIGGSEDDFASTLALSGSGDLYLAGGTQSADFPILNGLQPQFGGGDCSDAFDKLPCDDAFVMRWRSADMTLLYSTFLGGSGDDFANAIALDSAGNVYIAGSTASPNFPLVNPIQSKLGGGTCQHVTGQLQTACSDAFIAKISADGSTLLYSTLLGGNGADAATAIAVDVSGSAVVAGATVSADFPTVNAFQAQAGGGVCYPIYLLGGPAPCGDAFVAKLSPQGNSLVFSTYLGGGGDDAATAMVMDSAGNIYVGGATDSRGGFPVTPGALHYCNSSGGTSFLTELTPDGSLAYSSFFLDASDIESIATIATNGPGRLYLGGQTGSGDLPVTTDSLQQHLAPTSFGGFLAEIDLTLSPPSTPAVDPTCVVNAAGYFSLDATGSQSGVVAPGEIVSIFGSGIGPAHAVDAHFDAAGHITTSLADTTVTFDGRPAPLLYVQANQINTIVPFEAAGTSTLQVAYRGVPSNAVTLHVAGAAPGIFTMKSLGSGQAAALNHDGTLNSPSNPAAKGSVISIWATGLGLLDVPYLDGQIVMQPVGKLVVPAHVYIDGEEAALQYIGQAPGLVAGAIQINAVIPADAPSGDAVRIYIDNLYQNVTIAIQ